MIILTVKAKALPEDCNELIQSIRSMCNRTRQLESCLVCECYRNINEENDLCLIGYWPDQERVEDYIDSDLFSALKGAIRVLSSESTIEIGQLTRTLLKQ